MFIYAIPVMIVILLASRAAKAFTPYTPPGNMLQEPAWSKWDKLFQKYGREYGVDWRWLKAISMTESNLGLNKSVALGLRDPSNKNSVSDDKLSWGLMQIRVSTAQQFDKSVTYKDLNNPEKAVKLAAQFIQWIKKQFPKDSDKVLMMKTIMSYNQGVGNTQKSKTYALPYWKKFEKHMEIINSKL